MAIAANVLLFQLGWFACVLGAARDWAREGVALALAIVAVHVARAARPRREILLVAVAAATGALFDSLLASAGWLRYAGAAPVEGAAPYWIVALWALFAITLNVSMRSLRGRPLLGALLGLAGGPLAYLGGEKLGAVALVQPLPALAALALVWALATPLMLALALRLERA
jgi:Protein of unknown function (DUF2878)